MFGHFTTINTHAAACQRRQRAHKGQAVLESIAGIIIFVVMMALMANVSVYLYMQNALTTAAREGARKAAMSTGLSGSDLAGATAAIKDHVQDVFATATGQLIDDANIQIDAPDSQAAQGDRDVQVSVTFEYETPIDISGFVTAFGEEDGASSGTFDMTASAKMHYEE